MQMVPFNLNLRTESLVPPDILEKTRDNSELPPLPPSNGPPAYTCLLTTHPLSIPPILERPLGLPTIAKLAVPKSHNIKSEIVLTPETLRYLANVSERIAGEIHEVHLAGHHIKSYADLLRQEFDRQQKRLADVLARTQALVGPRKAYVLEYEKRVQENQKVLLARMDKVLQTLIKKASPELNEHETRWFNELQRMKAQVLGVGKHDSQSLKYRVRQVSSKSSNGLSGFTDRYIFYNSYRLTITEFYPHSKNWPRRKPKERHLKPRKMEALDIHT